MILDSKNTNFNREDSIDLKKLVKKFKKYWKLFAFSILTLVSFGVLLLKYVIHDKYLVGSALIIKQETNPLLGTDDLLGSINLLDGTQNMENQINLLKSFSLLKQSVLDLNHYVTIYSKGQITNTEIYRNSPFSVEIDTNHVQLVSEKIYVEEVSPTKFRLSTTANNFWIYDFKSIKLKKMHPISKNLNISEIYSYGQTIQSEYFKFKITKKNASNNTIPTKNDCYFIINNPDFYATELQSQLSVEQVNLESTILDLKLEHTIPKKAQDFLNKLMDDYINHNLSEKNIIANNTLSFITAKLMEVTDSMHLAEEEMKEFKVQNKIFDLNHEAVAVFDQIRLLEENKAKEITNLDYYKYLGNYVANSTDLNNIVAPSVVGVQDVLLNNLINELRVYYSERTRLQYIAKGKNPHYQMLMANIEDTKSALSENIKSHLANSQLVIKNIDQQIGAILNENKSIPEKQRKYLGIERRFNFNNSIYVYLLEKQAEVGIAKASEAPHAKIIEYARLLDFNPVFPNKKIMMFFLVFLGLTLPLIFVIFKELLNEKIEDNEEIEKFGIPILGALGHNKSTENLPVLVLPKSTISETFRTVRTNLLYLARNKTSKVIGLTSTVSGEGKTFCSSNLACSIAISGKKTIIIGVDLRKPQLHNVFKLKNSKGLSSYLIDQCSLDEVIFNTQNPNLDVITSGPVPPNPSELLSEPKFKYLLDELKMEYEYIILDSPPIGLVSDYFILSEFTDSNLFITRKKYSKISYVSDFKSQIEIKKLSNVYLILNDDKNLLAKYGNRYSGYYEEESKQTGLFKKKSVLA